MSIGNDNVSMKLRTNKDVNGHLQRPSRKCKICKEIVLNAELHLKKNHNEEYQKSIEYVPNLSFDESAFRYLSHFQIYTENGWKDQNKT